MAICPFCGNEVEEFDFMCGRCGRELSDPAVSLPAMQSNNVSVTEIEYEQSQYGEYNSDLDTGVNKKNYEKDDENKGKRIRKKLIILAVIIVIAYLGYQKIRSALIKPYQNVVREAVISVIEDNYDVMISNRVVDYDSMFAEYYGYLYVGLKQLYRQQNEEVIKEMKKKYGDDYTITITIQSTDDMSGASKDEAIDRAISTQNEEFRLDEIDLDYGAYLNKSIIKKVKRVKVKATIKGSKGEKESGYVVDIAKTDGKMNWRVLYVYED